MIETRYLRVLARVAKELELVQSIPDPVLILNNCYLASIPPTVLSDEHCIRNLRELSLQNNLIEALVKILICINFTLLLPPHFHAAKGDITIETSF
jgi:hypothetical protein